MQVERKPKKNKEEPAKIYLSTDHLKKGQYELHLLSDTEVVKIIPFKK